MTKNMNEYSKIKRGQVTQMCVTKVVSLVIQTVKYSHHSTVQRPGGCLLLVSKEKIDLFTIYFYLINKEQENGG